MRTVPWLAVATGLGLIGGLAGPALADPVPRVAVVYTGDSHGITATRGSINEMGAFFDSRIQRDVKLERFSMVAGLRRDGCFLFDRQAKLGFQALIDFLRVGGLSLVGASPEVPALSSPYNFMAQIESSEQPWVMPWLLERNQILNAHCDAVASHVTMVKVQNAKGAQLDLLSEGPLPSLSELFGDVGRWEPMFGAMVDAKRGLQTARVLGAARIFADGARRVALVNRLAREGGIPTLKVDLGNSIFNAVIHKATESLALDLEAVSSLHYDALVPSVEELRLQPAELKALGEAVPLVAANLEADPATGVKIVPYLIKEVGGRRIILTGIVDDKALIESRVVGLNSPWHVTDPFGAIDRLDKLANEIAFTSRDAVVVMTNMKGERLMKLSEDLRKAEVLLAAPFQATGHFAQRETIEISDARSIRGDTHPILTTGITGSQVGRVVLQFEGPSLHSRVRGLTNEVQTLTEDLPSDPYFRKRLSTIAAETFPQLESEGLLPDMRVVAPGVPALNSAEGDPEIGYDSTHFSQLIAALLRRGAGSEVGICPILEHGIDAPGVIARGVVEGWLDTPDQIVTLTLSGADLKALVSLLPAGKELMTFAGYQPKLGLVDGRKLDPEERYRVVTTDRITQSAMFAEVFGGKKARRDLRLAGERIVEGSPAPLKLYAYALATLATLRDRHAGFTDSYLDEFRPLLTDDGTSLSPRMMAKIEGLSFKLNDYRVSNAEPFSTVRNSQINTPSNLAWGGKGQLSVVYDAPDLTWDNRAKFAYDKMVVQLKDQQFSQENSDNVELSSEFRLNVIKLAAANSAFSLVPYVSGVYETEFTPTIDTQTGLANALQRDLDAGAGVVLYPGGALKELRLGALAKHDFATSRGGLQPGFRVSALLEQQVMAIRPITLRLEGDFKNYVMTPDDTPQDLGMLASLSGTVRIPVWDNLSLSLGADALWFSGKLSSNRTVGSVLSPTIGLVYTTTWKPQFGIWF